MAMTAISAPTTTTGLAQTATPVVHAVHAQTIATAPIKHVIVIDMENHSFDNVFGFWCDAHPARCPDGGMPPSVKLSDGAVVTPFVDPDTIPDIQHSVQAQLAAMNIQHGVPQMNGWQNIPGGSCAAATKYQCISGYTPSQIPNVSDLAKTFAISDRFFSMGDSPSWGGHLYAVMGTLDNFTGENPQAAPGVTTHQGWGCDSDKIAAWVSPATGKIQKIPSCIPDAALGLPNGGAFQPTPASYRPTIMDELRSAGLSWKIYGAANPSDGGYDWAVCPSIAECLYTSQGKNLIEASQFITDASGGNLPAFSLVVAGGAKAGAADSCHNKFSMTACDNYVGRLVSAVENGADWSSSAIFLTFDDFGGFYDQVPPSVNPDGTRQGPRLPLIIISPYAKPGFTDTTATSFAGILAYAEHTFGLSPLTVNDKSAYDFSNAFDYAQTPLEPPRLVQRPLPASARHISPTAVGDDPT
jgi:phospholipase C